MENWCHLCKQEGKDVVAKFSVDGRPACAAHFMAWRKDHPLEHPAPLSFNAPEPTEKPMTKNLDYAEMQKERDSGIPVSEIAKKHDCNVASVYNNTKKKVTVKKPGRLSSLADAARAREEFHPKRNTRESFSKNGTISELLVKLRARRAAIDEAITAIEMAEQVLAKSEELA